MRATILVRVKPGVKQPGFSFEDDAIVLRVRERAVDGAANAACIRALAQALRIAHSNIALLRGERSRLKIFAVDGMTREEALERLRGKGA